jgi:LmbE family N-acetylglucosaminyl deacetylase
MGDEFIPQRAMSIHAHPDDQEFTVAGTLAKWARAGCEIISVVITSGDSGSNDPDKDAAYKVRLAELREEEQRRANAVLGIKQTIFLRYLTANWRPPSRSAGELTRAIRQYRPDVVVTGNMEVPSMATNTSITPTIAAARLPYAVFPQQEPA